MQRHLPPLRLTHGPLLWTLGQGASPQGPRRRLLLDQLRYLRLLGVPFAEQGRGQGRERAIRYAYEEVVEMAVALFALRRGMRPHLIADDLVTNRTTLHRLFGRTLEAQPATALQASWLKGRGRHQAVPAHEWFLRLHTRMRNVSSNLLGAAGAGDQARAEGTRGARRHPLIRGTCMNEAHTLSPDEYTDEERLHTVQALQRHGHGSLTLEAHDHHVTDIEELHRHRKVPRAGKHRVSAMQTFRGDPSTDARLNDPFRAVGPGSVVGR